MVRSFLFSRRNKEFLIFLFFLMLSGIFWLMLALNETYERDISVPVKLTGIPQNVVVTDGMEDTVRITVRDKGFALMSYLYGEHVVPVSISFAQYADKDTGRGVVPIADVQRAIVKQLFSSSKLVSVKSGKIEFFFCQGNSRRLPVKLTGDMLPDGTFYVSSTRIVPESVMVYATPEMIDSIRYVQTERLDIDHLQDTLHTQVALQKIRGVKTVPSTVTVTLCPDVLTEESMEVPVTVENIPDDKVLRLFPSRVKVRFSVGASIFRTIKPEQFKVVVDYESLIRNPSEKCTLQLRHVPDGVKKARLETTQVDYLIEQRS